MSALKQPQLTLEELDFFCQRCDERLVARFDPRFPCRIECCECDKKISVREARFLTRQNAEAIALQQREDAKSQQGGQSVCPVDFGREAALMRARVAKMGSFKARAGGDSPCSVDDALLEF